MIILPGLLLAMALAMLDNMIVGTAMPRILVEFGGLAHMSWVVTAYVLGTTVSTPIWGKIGDLYGRKSIFIISIVIFMIGSALCGMAGSAMLGGPENGMAQLIAFRAVQGLGAGGLMVNVMAIIGDLVPPRERGQYQGIMAGVMSLTMIAGPLVGGFITDNLDWRWAFYVNLPVGAIALVLLVLKLHLPPLSHSGRVRIDWPGAVLLSISITSMVLITTWGGNDYAWGSWQILGLAALAVVTLAWFIQVERKAAEPIMPLQLFRNRNFTLISAIGFLLGFAMFGAINFLPVFQQLVQGATATNSGLLLLPMMAAAMVVSLFVGRAITSTGKYKIYPVIGGVGMAVGMWLLSTMDVSTPAWLTGVYIAVLGLGMGFLMQTTMLIAQNSVEQRDLGVASSASTFFRSIGGSFGVSLFGAVFNNQFLSELTARFGPEAAEKLAKGGARMDASALGQMPAQQRTGLLESLATSLSGVFWWAILFAVVVPVLAAFVKEIPLRGGAPADGPDGQDGPDIQDTQDGPDGPEKERVTPAAG
ncbi:MFS transporter [Nonomuraea zeae]|uniref:MFS transporter n=2 Tax=Nonomuraea zeae TaxID=1642303 RepID=A0A5S4GUH0_9ACTN|nr:MDR family MFS transporter [Nonomuraea zeae]TMR36596.1 MFS transporter [Nonomuraea zeae]